MNRSTHLGQGLTVGQVQDLMQEAGKAGDDKMVETCLDALECDQASLKKIIEVLEYSRGNMRRP